MKRPNRLRRWLVFLGLLPRVVRRDVAFSPEDVQRRLRSRVRRFALPLPGIWPRPGTVVGRVGKMSFSVYRVSWFRNSWTPFLRGRITATERGSRIEATVGVHPAVRAFMVLWFGLLLVFEFVAAGLLISGAPTSPPHSGWIFFLIPLGMAAFGVGLTTLGRLLGGNGMQLIDFLDASVDGSQTFGSAEGGTNPRPALPPPPTQPPPPPLPPVPHTPPHTYLPQPYPPQAYGAAPSAFPPYGAPYRQAAWPRSNGVATAAFVVGVIAIVLSWVPLFDIVLAAPAVILGGLGVTRANRMEGMGKGLAIAGLILGAISILVTLVMLAVVVATSKPTR